MREVKPGIYSLDGRPFSERNTPLVLVHPWFLGFYAKYKRVDTQVYDHSYLHNVKHLLREQKGAVVILEERKKLEKTEREVGKTRTKTGVYFVPTGEGTVPDKPSDLRRLAAFVKRFDGSVKMGGGYLIPDPLGVYNGCLAFTWSELLKRNVDVEIVKDCCFTL